MEYSSGKDTVEFSAEIQPDSSEINFSCVTCVRTQCDVSAEVLCIFNFTVGVTCLYCDSPISSEVVHQLFIHLHVQNFAIVMWSDGNTNFYVLFSIIFCSIQLYVNVFSIALIPFYLFRFSFFFSIVFYSNLFYSIL